MKTVSTLLLLLAAAVPAGAGQPTLHISNVKVVEGSHDGYTVANFKVTLTDADAEVAVTVHWATQDMTATGDVDYVADEGDLLVTPDGNASINVSVIQDNEPGEGSEVFFVRLSSPSPGTVILANELGHGIIVDDDSDPRGRARCDLDPIPDGQSNLLVFHPDLRVPQGHTLTHRDWETGGTLVNPTNNQVHYSDNPAEHQEEWRLTAMNDFDGSGTCDLFWEKDDEVAITFTIDHLFAPHPWHVLPIPRPAPEWRLVGSGDFDADGRADLLWWNTEPEAPTLQLWSNQATGIVISTRTADIDPGWHAVAVINPFVGDGAGILWRQTTSGSLRHWRMSGLAMLASAQVRYPKSTLIDTTWRPAAVGDFNGDGTDDLVWQHVPTSSTAIWLMRGLNQTRESWLSPSLLVPPETYLGPGVIDGPR